MSQIAPGLPSRYERRAVLGTGGVGRVERVFDHARGEEVALKLLVAPGGGAADVEAAFRREFWALATFRHPHLAEALDFGTLPGGQPYFTMALVPGAPLAALTGPRPEAEVRAWLPGLLDALDALHARGFVHGDLSPENVRLRPDGQAVLMDLGLLAREGAWDGELAGTLAGLAPEAVRSAARDRRADLYALGCLLYRVLAGAPPFEPPHGPARSPAELLRAHQEVVPTPIARLAPGLSAELAALVGRLLAKRPGDRPADVAEVRAALGLPAGEAGGRTAPGDRPTAPDPRPVALDQGPVALDQGPVALDQGPVALDQGPVALDQGPLALLEGPIVGHEDALAALDAFFAAPGPATCLLSGPAGAGKSRLLRHARVAAQLAGRPAHALRGQGREAAPYQAVAGLLRVLLAEAAEGPAGAVALARAWFLVGGGAASPLDANRERLRAHAALAELALAAWPEAVWLVDDADALDPASRAVLDHLRLAGAAAGRGWRWVLAEGDERGPAGAPSEAGPAPEAPVMHLALSPLTGPALEALAADALGAAPPATLAGPLATLSAGRPGRARALLAAWRRDGALVHTAGAWAFDPAAASLPAEATAAEAGGSGPLAGLPAPARGLATLAAVLGSHGALADLAALAEASPAPPEASPAPPEASSAPPEASSASSEASPAPSEASPASPEASFGDALWALAGAGVLTLTGDHYAFADAGAALALRAALPPADRAAMHARCFARLTAAPDAERRPLGALLAIARHGLDGHVGAPAWPWLLAAVHRALRVAEFDAAGALLRKAEGAPVTPAQEDALAVLRAHVHRARGEADAALALLDDARLARLAAEGPADHAHLVVTLGVLLQLKGRYAEALARFREADTLARAAGADDAVARANFLAGRAAFFLGDAAATEAHLTATLAAAERPGGARFRGWGLALYGHWLATRGGADAPRGEAMLAEAVALGREGRDPYGTLEALNDVGDVRLAQGRPTAAQAAFAEALAIAARHGLAVEALFAQVNLAFAAIARGEPREARKHALAALQGARAQGRRYPEGLARAALGQAEALAGDPALGLAELAEAAAMAEALGNRYLALIVAVARAETALLLGDWAGAEGAVAAADALAAATGDHAHADRLAACRLALGVLAGGADGAGADAGAAGRAAGSAPAAAPAAPPARIDVTTTAAQARALDAEAAFWRGDLDHAEALATELGLGRLRAEVALARALAAAPPGDADAPAPDSLDRDRADTPAPTPRDRADTRAPTPGDRDRATTRAPAALEALAAAHAEAQAAGLALHEAALAERLAALRGDRPELRREATRRLREVAAPLDAPARAALAAHPWWAPLAQAPAEAEPLARFAGLVAELARAPGPAAMLECALLAAVDAAEAERGFLVLYDGLAITGSVRVGRDAPGFTDFSLGLAHRVLFSGEPCFLEDVTADGDLAARASVRGLGIRAVAAVPLRIDGAVAGVLITDARQPRPRPWGPERKLLAALADHVAVALGALLMAEAARVERDALAVAHRLALDLMAAPDPAAARRLALGRAMAHVRARAAWLYAADGGPEARIGEGPEPAAARALSAWVRARGGAIAVPHEEGGATGALWALPAGEAHVLVVAREAGGPEAAETAALVKVAEVLGALGSRFVGESGLSHA